MRMMDTVVDKAGGLAKKAPEMAHKQAAGVAKKKLTYNVVGDVCTWAFTSEKNQTRCKAASRLYDIGKSGVKAVGSCGTMVGAGAAEVGTGGLATPVAAPVGIVAAGSCVYNTASMGDSTWAMAKQVYSGEETKTYREQGTEMAGTWIKKKLKKGYDAWLESQTRMPPVYMPMPF